ncbi:MAG: histidinol dehydrogenase [Rhizobiales bacterium]|nr:histidinol dehydrogenase [Hyphomicrobiales bacterium]
MVARLNNQDSEFEQQFQTLLNAKRESAADVNDAVSEIIKNVRINGNDALYEFTERFDNQDLKTSGLAITDDEIDEAIKNVPAETMQALELAATRIESHHKKQQPENQRYTDEIGVELGYRWSPVTAAGLYVPGGTASYPSSVLMNAIPAKVAGVERLVMVVPTPNGVTNPLVLAAAKLAGIKEIYRIGGAQAIAALTFGTETISPVDKIVGPGNAYVAAAKRQVFGTVGIDMIAGPSEVLIIADKNNNPDWIAADLLAQAEHDVAAQSILITDAPDLASEVEKAVTAQLTTLPRGDIAGKAWADFGAIILVDELEKAAELSDRLAPEHLELALDDPETMFEKIKHAGAVFIGHHTPEAIGDYVGGSNHVLPTARSARFSSGLNVLDFMKKTTILKCSADGLRALGPSAITLAEAEGLGAHARSVSIRMN